MGRTVKELGKDDALVERTPRVRSLAATRLSIGLMASLLPLVDGLCLATGFFLAYLLRFRSSWWPYQGLFSAHVYALLTFWVILGWLGLFGFYQLYEPETLFGGTEEYRRVVNACILGTLLVSFYAFTSSRLERIVSRGWLFLAAFLATACVLVARFAYRRLVYGLRRRGLLQRRALIVGLNAEGRDVLRQIGANPNEGYRPVGIVDDRVPIGSSVDNTYVIGRLAQLGGIVRNLGITDLIVAPTALTRGQLLDLYQTFGHDPGLQIQLSTGLYELYTTQAQVKEVAFVPLVSLSKMRITGANAALKSFFDYGGAALLLVLLSPLLAAVALWVRRDSPGPALYRRRVAGVGGKTFDAFKFRTMYLDGDRLLEDRPDLVEELRANGKLRDDPRVTRAGRFLRRLSLDELPQLVNVLRGEMSLVGPRMITPAELAKFGKWRHNLLTVRPGLTGLWQISGRSDIGYEERTRLDMNYIRNYTLWLDLHILMNTVTTVLRGRGAY